MPDHVRPAVDLRAALHGIRGLLIDLDGVLVLAGRAIPGAAAALRELDRRGIPYLIATNTSLVSRSTLAGIATQLGFAVPAERFHSALSATAAFTARQYRGQPIYVICSADARTEFTGQRLIGDDEAGHPNAEVAAVVLGDSPDTLTREHLDRAFRLVRGGAALIGMHRNLWWLTPGGPALDAGAFLLGLEAATGIRATIVGKPTPAFFRLAADRLAGDIAATGAERPRRGELAMVGDDVDADIGGARRVGLRTVFVRTGKHGDAELAAAANRRASVRPDGIAPSIAEVVAALGG